jgi:hypothetical protein
MADAPPDTVSRRRGQGGAIAGACAALVRPFIAELVATKLELGETRAERDHERERGELRAAVGLLEEAQRDRDRAEPATADAPVSSPEAPGREEAFQGPERSQ